MSLEHTSSVIAENDGAVRRGLPDKITQLTGLSNKSEELRKREVRLQTLLKEKEGEISVTTKEKLEQDTKLRTTQRESSELGKQISERR